MISAEHATGAVGFEIDADLIQTVQRPLPRGCEWSSVGVWVFVLSMVLSGKLTAAPTGDLAAPVHPVDGSFVREWLVLGPFPSRDLETDFLASMGGEMNVRPKEGDTVTTKDGKQLVWTRLRSKHDVVDLDRVFGIQEWSVAYAYCDLNSSQSIDTDARSVSLHPGVLWFNGKKVGQTPKRTDRADDLPPVVPIQLNAGRNACVLKLRIESGSWTFAFQPLPPERATAELHATDPAGRPVTGALIRFYDQGEQVARLQSDATGIAEACLYPSAESYDVRLTSGELGTWLYDLALRPGERRKLDVVLTNAVSISGRVLAMDGSPQTAIVVQALRVSENSVFNPGRADLPVRRDATQGERSDVLAPRLGEAPASLHSPAPQSEHRGSDALPKEVRAAQPRLPYRTFEPQINLADDGRSGTRVERVPTDPGRIRSLLPMPAFSETVLSDTNGSFRFVNLRPGQYQLRAHGSRGYVYPAGENGPDPSKRILVEPGRTDDRTKFVFPEAKKGVWNRYANQKGLINLKPGRIHRAPDGMLWVGAEQGTLHTYDGVEFKLFSSPEIPARFVSAIRHDAQGTLWIGTTAGFRRMASGRIQTPPFSDTLPGKVVGSIETDPDGTVWFSTTSGLVKYEGRQFVRMTVKEGLPSSVVGALLRARDGGLWMSTSRSLARFDGRSFSEPVLLHGIRDPTLERLHQAKDGAIWFCSRDQIAVYRYDGTTLSRLGEEEGLLGHQIADIVETSDGLLWFATDKGLSGFDGTTLLNYTVSDGLSAGDVLDIFVDSDDVLWCATGRGVARFDPKAFTGITKRDGFGGLDASAGVFAIEPDTQGGYLIGTERGGVYQLGGQDRPSLTHLPFLGGAYVRHIHRSPDGTLWFGTSNGIYKETDGRVVKVLESNEIVALNSDDQGQLWFGHGWKGGGVTRFNPKTREETTFMRAQGLPDDSVWAIERGSNGSVWIGTDAGLAQFREGQIEKVGEKLRIPSGGVMNLRRDAEGTLWIGSGTGLHRLSGTNVISLTATNDAPIKGVWCSARTADGLIWVGTDKNGLLGYDGQAVTMIDQGDGLLGNRVFTLRPDGDDSLLIGLLDGGLTRYGRTKTPPSVRFIEVQLEDQTLSDFVNLPATEIGKRISVQYQEIDLKTHLEKRQFRYRVDGPSGEMLFAGITKERRFGWTPGKGGDYTFEVQAIDRDLNYSKPARLTFRAWVPWYSNAWILAPGGSAFGGLVIWAFIARALYVRKSRETIRLREQLLVQERHAREALETSNRSLLEAKAAAEEANRAKSTFLANMSHEIRTPLNAVLGYAQILQRDQRLEDDQRQAVNTIDRSGSHLLELINEILDLSKIEAGQMELVETDFDLGELIRGLSEMFELRCRQKSLEWECGLTAASLAAENLTTKNAESAEKEREEISDPSLRSLRSLRLTSIPVHGDEVKLRQVLINLLGNAVKFTDAGCVALRVERHVVPPSGGRAGTHLLPARARGEMIERTDAAPAEAGTARFSFEVADTGPGIAPTLRERIFEPFTQGTEGRRKGGTGLGLTIARRHIELMGGQLHLESEPSQGSRFFFTLALGPALAELPEKSERSGQRARRLQAGTKVRALVADDVAENRDVLSWFLKDLGVAVTVVEDGEQAMRELGKDRSAGGLVRSTEHFSQGAFAAADETARAPYEIAFLDIRMPKLTGLQVAQKLLEESGAGRTKLVAISASVLKHEQSLYEEAGFDAFVPKPFRVEELVECLETQLGVSFEYDAPNPTHNRGRESKSKITITRETGIAAASESKEALVDAKRLDELFGDDHDRRRRYLKSYLRHTTAQLDQLRDAVKAGHASDVELLAHRCKGASANLGITAMAQAMEKLEEAALSKDLADGPRLLAEAQESLALVQTHLQRD